METILTTVLGLSLRAVCYRLTSIKVGGGFVGLWEGIVLYHFLGVQPSSKEPYLTFVLRLFLDCTLWRNGYRSLITVCWAIVVYVVADVGQNVSYHSSTSPGFDHISRRAHYLSRTHTNEPEMSLRMSSKQQRVGSPKLFAISRSKLPTTNPILVSHTALESARRDSHLYAFEETIDHHPDSGGIDAAQIPLPTSPYESRTVSRSPGPLEYIYSGNIGVAEIPLPTSLSECRSLSPVPILLEELVDLEETVEVIPDTLAGDEPAVHPPLDVPVLPVRDVEDLHTIHDHDDVTGGSPFDFTYLLTSRPELVLGDVEGLGEDDATNPLLEPPMHLPPFHEPEFPGSPAVRNKQVELLEVDPVTALSDYGSEPTVPESIVSPGPQSAILARAATLRSDAERAMAERNRLTERGQKALRQGRAKEAFLMKMKAADAEKRALDLNAKAERRYIHAHNRSYSGLHKLDVHGLKPAEAIRRVEIALHDVIERGDHSLTVIVGRGRHSPRGKAVLRPAIIKEMERQMIDAKIDPANPGVVKITI